MRKEADKKSLNKTTLVALSSMAILMAPEAVNAKGGAVCVSGNLAINITQQPLRFGQAVPCSGSPGTIRVKPNNQRLTAGCFSSVTGTFQPAKANVTGTGKVAIKVAPAAATLSTTGAAETLTLNLPVLRVKGSSGTTFTVTLKTGANTAVTVGFTANVAAAEPSGTYTGAFTLSATCAP